MPLPSPRALLPPSQTHNINTLHHTPLAEISGSLGDLGTLLPLLLALTLTQSISLPSTLIFTGLANILTGIYFRIPLPVQPMKAIAAVAIANNFSVTQTTSAGMFVGAVVFVAAITGVLGWIGRSVPIPVVKGIQVGAGISLAISGGSMINETTSWYSGDSKLLALIAFLALLLTTRPVPMGAGSAPRIPYALLVTAIGITTGVVLAARSSAGLPHFFSLWKPTFFIPDPAAFRTGVLTAGLGQLPLTVLNSIIAVTHLSAALLPPPTYPSPPSFTALGISVGVANLVGAWFGAMPVCHGSGGLAGQVKFGGRSGSSVVLLGVLKLALGVVVGEGWLVGVLEGFPRGLLGVMVVGAGVELGRVGEGINVDAVDLEVDGDESGGVGGLVREDGGKRVRELDARERTERWYVMIVTVALLLAFKNDAVGFLAGLLTHAVIKMPVWRGRWRGGGDDGERRRLLS